MKKFAAPLFALSLISCATDLQPQTVLDSSSLDIVPQNGFVAVSVESDDGFYALNFARHRATLAIRYRFGEGLEFSLDNEYRKQEDNPLRTTSGEAFVVSASLAWAPANGSGFGVAVTADNLTDDDYQQFPGTPAVGRQVSISARYRW